MAFHQVLQAVSTVHGGREYGRHEVIASALIGWLIEGKSGQLFIHVRDGETGEEAETTVQLGNFTKNKAVVDKKPN